MTEQRGFKTAEMKENARKARMSTSMDDTTVRTKWCKNVENKQRKQSFAEASMTPDQDEMLQK
jgi:hypothetical protein